MSPQAHDMSPGVSVDELPEGRVVCATYGEAYHTRLDCGYVEKADRLRRPMDRSMAEAWDYDECNECQRLGTEGEV